MSARRWRRTKGGLIMPAKKKVRRKNLQDDLGSPCMMGQLEIVKVPKGAPAGFPGQRVYRSMWEPIRQVVSKGPNLVVDSGREAAALLLGLGGAGASTNKHIAFMAIGRGSSGGTVVPLPTDTALGLETLRKSTTNDFPTTSSVRATMVVLDTESNTPPDDEIDEAGLFAADTTTMIARRTFPTLTKTSSFSFEFRWRINT